MPRTDFSDTVRNRQHESAPHSTDILRLREFDTRLVADLYEKSQHPEDTEFHCQNEEFAELIKVNYTPEELATIEKRLHNKGTTNVSTVDSYSVEIDGITQPISFVAATEITKDTPNHGEMSSMLYLRDHIQTASVLMELHLNDRENYQSEAAEGKRLLMSALHLMSTPAQLERFQNVIEHGGASQEDWPHISLLFDDLEAEGPNGWRNKQDTFQMLAYLTCDAIERGFIDVGSLSESHKKFLGSVAPLLKSVGFPKYESSGSWEEIAARRTSVMAVETALLDKIVSLSENNEELAFLRGDLDAESVATLRDEGLHEIGRRLPFESPDYPKDSIKYREADAALTYVLMYDIPKLLADKSIPTGPSGEAMSEQAIENLVLSELATLIDPVTGGMRRYNGDSYQRVNFHTNEVQQTVADIKHVVKEDAGDGEIDLDKKQRLRDLLTPKGREATWTHPLGQLSAWAAKRSITARRSGQIEVAENYRVLSTRFLNQTIATITGNNQYHAVLNAKKQYIIKKVPADRLPECLVTYETPQGTVFTVPSPHTPLNWSSAMLKEAVGLLRVSTVLQ
jgi:hypothetical protein